MIPVSDDAMGQISAGFIRLQGKIFACQLYPQETQKPLESELGLRIGSHELAKEKTIVSSDVKSDDISGVFYCLPLIQIDGEAKTTSSTYSWVGLILRSVSGTNGVYERFGTFGLDGREAQEVLATQGEEDQICNGLYSDVEQRTLILI